MIHAMQFEAEFVRPTLARLAAHNDLLYTDTAVTLMMGTAAQESDLGFYLRQWPRGPGRGFWQVESATHDDVWRYLRRPANIELARIVLSLSRGKTDQPHSSELINNPLYSCAIARLKFWMVPEALPDTLEEMGEYWDKFYNANPDHGTPQEFIDSYNKYVVGTGV